MDLVRFRRVLLQWYRRAQRDLPWRRTRDPYRIWISEVMLQQTRVAAALPFYERFLARFPDVATLAVAPESELLSAWAGLGYYSRARNLHKAAQSIVDAGGDFPSSYEGLIALPGVGKYTAAAIASIAYDLPHASVDGNLLRVLARLLDDPGDIASSITRARFELLAAELLDRRHPAEFNQAMMELGATICLPRNPNCALCPVRQFCAGLAAGRVQELPVKLRNERKVFVDAVLLAIERPGGILMRQRPATESQMPGFWELPELGTVGGGRVVLGAIAGRFRHTITFRRHRYTVQRATLIGRAPKPLKWLSPTDLEKTPITTAANKALRCLLV